MEANESRLGQCAESVVRPVSEPTAQAILTASSMNVSTSSLFLSRVPSSTLLSSVVIVIVPVQWQLGAFWAMPALHFREGA